jgi:hypothetical protein
MNVEKWTVVQHSGYGYAEKEGFKQATEVRKITNKTELKLVEKVGGLVFDNYLMADEYTERANYPAANGGLHPRASGTFSDKTIDGLRIYLPVVVTG